MGTPNYVQPIQLKQLFSSTGEFKVSPTLMNLSWIFTYNELD